jgi:hypothetical protein
MVSLPASPSPPHLHSKAPGTLAFQYLKGLCSFLSLSTGICCPLCWNLLPSSLHPMESIHPPKPEMSTLTLTERSQCVMISCGHYLAASASVSSVRGLTALPGTHHSDMGTSCSLQNRCPVPLTFNTYDSGSTRILASLRFWQHTDFTLETR